jgi:hypothetical protein
MKTLITSLITAAFLASVASAATFNGFATTNATIAGGNSTFLISDGGDGFDFDATIAGLTFAVGSSLGSTNDTVFAYNASQAFPGDTFVISGNANFSNTSGGLSSGSEFALFLFDGVTGSSVTTVGGEAFGFHTGANWTVPANDAGTYSFGAQFTPLAGPVGAPGTVVPEPSSYALLGGLLALGCVMLRRRA